MGKLDKEAEEKLCDTLARHDKERKAEYYVSLDVHLGASSNPSAIVMTLLRKIGEGIPLGEPKGAGKGKGKDGDKGKDGKGGDKGSSKDSGRDVRDGGDRRDQDRD